MRVSRLAAVALALLVLAPVFAQAAPPAKADVLIRVYIDVAANGNATVTYVVSGKGKYSFWLFLPKFEEVRGAAVKGGFRIVENRTSSFYFYYNSTVEASPGGDGGYEFNLSYEFPYASIMAGYNGWFMSPALIAEPDVVMEVYVKIPFLKRVTLEEPRHVGRFDGYLVYTLYGSAYMQLAGRVTIEYDMTRPTPTAKILGIYDGVKVVIDYPVYYKGFAEKTARVAGKAVPIYNRLFGASPSAIEFRFYLPKKAMGGIGTLGFMRGSDVNVGGRGPIELNLALMRYAPGYHETTVLHEMVHKYLGMIGVEATDETRWFHEGMAQYVSIMVGGEIGVPVGDLKRMLDNSSERLVKHLGGKLGFIQEWPYGSPELEGEAYLASYYIIKTVADRYGGEAYIERLSKAIRDMGGVRTTQDIVDAMSAAAGEDLSRLFIEWGFTGVKPWQPPAPPQGGSGGNETTGGQQEQPKQGEQGSGGEQGGAPGSPESFFSSARNMLITSALVLGGLAAFIVYLVNTKISREVEIAMSRVYVPGEDEEEDTGDEGEKESPDGAGVAP